MSLLLAESPSDFAALPGWPVVVNEDVSIESDSSELRVTLYACKPCSLFFLPVSSPFSANRRAAQQSEVLEHVAPQWPARGFASVVYGLCSKSGAKAQQSRARSRKSSLASRDILSSGCTGKGICEQEGQLPRAPWKGWPERAKECGEAREGAEGKGGEQRKCFSEK